MGKRKTKEKFIEEANKKHNNKFDYSKVEYVNTHEEVIIKCPIHGYFKQTPFDHLRTSSGCPKCATNRILNTNSFIELSRNVHNNKYDYSKVNYLNKKSKVCIICPEHGEFWQRAEDHYRGCGCRKCYNQQLINRQTLNSKVFLERANKKFNHKYIYDLSNYINLNSKIKITCPIHGEFEQKANIHLDSLGCPYCILKSQNALLEKLKMTFPNETFIWEYKAEWLGRQSIDICIEKYKIGVEYDGEQHFRPVDFFGGIESFQKQIENDALKNRKCKENGFYLFRLKFNYTDSDFYELCVQIKEVMGGIINDN